MSVRTIAGLARDGGLYVPESWPQFTADDIRAMKDLDYPALAQKVMAPFIGSAIPADDLKKLIDDAYATFDAPDVLPLKQLNDTEYLLELFHGPTLAFKDVAMQFLSRLMDRILAARNARATIVCATSGDTGGAAVEAFRGAHNVDIVQGGPRDVHQPAHDLAVAAPGCIMQRVALSLQW